MSRTYGGKFVIIKEILDASANYEAVPDVFGPFRNHQTANGAMQEMLDDIKASDLDYDEADDSDASHFYIISGDLTTHFWINEIQQVDVD